MNLTHILQQRYSTKQFDAQKQISKEDISQIKNLLRLSPSSVNLQPWHFVLADSDDGKARIAKSAVGAFAFNADKIIHAALSVVFCVRLDADAQYMEHLIELEDRSGRYALPEHKAMMKNGRQLFTDLHAKELGDLPHWMEKQVYLNMGSFLLGVAALGLDAVPMEGIDTAILDREFNLTDKGFRAIGVVSVGYRSEDDFNANLPKSRLPESEIFTVL